MPSRITRLQPEQYREMPWRNGGGSTTEIAIEPAGAGLGSAAPFVWRLSMARVEGDGPFSRFAGYDRTLVLLEGRGVRLDFGGAAPPVTLAGALSAAAFSGDWATSCRLLGGAVRDFNVMVDRTRAAAAVKPFLLPAQTTTAVELRGHTTLLYVQQGRVVLQLGPTEPEQTVSAGATLRLDGETSPASTAAQLCTATDSAQLILVAITGK